ncbi:MAG: MAPEG family protein [Ghiorsea sp.]|nr:MAPEG family protein [Ghiorsea sp.]
MGGLPLLPSDFTSGIGSIGERYIFALTHVFAASLLLFLGFLAVGATRWQLETKDPTANPAVAAGKAEKINLHNRVHTQFLSNTTEQFVMFSAAILAVTPFLSATYLKLITLMTILWIFGRLFFWGGYWYTVLHQLPTYPRAIGLGMGLLCTLTLAALAATGICLHFPDFSGLIQPLADAASADILIHPLSTMTASNLLPITFFSLMVTIMAALAVFPKIAPPVIPMALICSVGWVWLLVSGAIPIR